MPLIHSAAVWMSGLPYPYRDRVGIFGVWCFAGAFETTDDSATPCLR